jgi:hypothetical protein
MAILPPMKRRRRILAVKWGLNPNSSSLGVDITFLLVGTAVLGVLTPILSSIWRVRRSSQGDSEG